MGLPCVSARYCPVKLQEKNVDDDGSDEINRKNKPDTKGHEYNSQAAHHLVPLNLEMQH